MIPNEAIATHRPAQKEGLFTLQAALESPVLTSHHAYFIASSTSPFMVPSSACTYA